MGKLIAQMSRHRLSLALRIFGSGRTDVGSRCSTVFFTGLGIHRGSLQPYFREFQGPSCPEFRRRVHPTQNSTIVVPPRHQSKVFRYPRLVLPQYTRDWVFVGLSNLALCCGTQQHATKETCDHVAQSPRYNNKRMDEYSLTDNRHRPASRIPRSPAQKKKW